MFSSSYKIKNTKGELLANFPKDIKEIKLDYKTGTVVDFTPLNDCESVEHIQLVPIDGLPGRAILPPNLPNLKRLVIGLRVENPEVLAKYSNLEVLDIGGYDPKTLDFILNFPKLRSLNINAYNLETIEPLRNCPGLEGLDLLSCFKADLSPLSGCKNLKKLRLDFEPKGSEVLKELTNLEELTLDDFQTNMLDYIKGATKLKKLLLYRSRMNDFHTLQNLSNLTYLDLSFTKIDDQNLKHLSNLKNLNYLSLADNWRITDISPLGQLLNLEDLDMCNVKGPIDSLDPLRSLKKLKKLDLLNTPIKNDLFEPLLETQSLRELKIMTSNKQQTLELKKGLKNCEVTIELPPDPSSFIDIGYIRIWLNDKAKFDKDYRHMIVQDITYELKLNHNLEAEDMVNNYFKNKDPEILKKLDFSSFHSIFQVYSNDESALKELANALNEMAPK